MDIVKFHLANLLRFSGREGRQSFWIWVAIVVGVFMAGWMAIIALLFATTPLDSPPPFTTMPVAMGVWMAIILLLLAAAVTRRLHDAGRRGWWGLAPGFLLFVEIVLIAQLFNVVAAGQADGLPDDFIRLWGVIAAINMVYLAALVTLIIFCAAASQSDNRYGPANEGEAG